MAPLIDEYALESAASKAIFRKPRELTQPLPGMYISDQQAALIRQEPMLDFPLPCFVLC